MLVVGAGPAGLAAARELVLGGASVILVDRQETLGARKVCAGGILRGAWARARLGASISDGRAICFNRIVVRTVLGPVTLRAGVPFIAIMDRKDWARSRLAELTDLGVDVRLGERVVRLETETAFTTRGPIPAGRIVATDGAASRIRRLLGLTRGPVLRAFQISLSRSLASKFVPDLLEAPTVWLWPGRLGSGYAWAFPAPDELRLGCGAPERTLRKGILRKRFLTWLASLGLGSDQGRVSAGTIGCGYVGHRFGRILLAGDAAGLASPLTGEGIAQALVSGEEVAREILDPTYKSALVPNLATRHRRTWDALSKPWNAAIGYGLAGALLRLPALRDETLERYIVG